MTPLEKLLSREWRIGTELKGTVSDEYGIKLWVPIKDQNWGTPYAQYQYIKKFHQAEEIAAHVLKLENALKAAAGLREESEKLKNMVIRNNFHAVHDEQSYQVIGATDVVMAINNALAAFDKALGEAE